MMGDGMDQAADSIAESINGLLKWVDHSYEGWDPFDGLNSGRFDHFQKMPNFLKILLIQFNKISPLNIRPVLSIEPGIDTKGVSLFLQSYCRLHESGVSSPLTEDGPFLFSRLMKESIQTDNTISWSSHYFDYIGVDGSILTPHTSDLIGTSNAIKALCQYSRYQDFDIEGIIRKYHNFLKESFDRDHQCYRYGHFIGNKYVPNCDAEVISSIHYANQITKNDEINDLCLISLKKLIETQNKDGSWFYSYYHDGLSRKQLDFHQGYIIDGLIDSLEIFPDMKIEIIGSIKEAVKSYDSIFSDEGRGYYRFPRRYPTDIHNQAQGMITYLRLYEFSNDKKFLDMSKKICSWTIENMQDSKGYFHYQKGRVFSNRIPYMRWSEAWMMLALSQILGSIRTEF